MTKQALRQLRDNETQTDIGRQIINKMLDGEHDTVRMTHPFSNDIADDDPRSDADE